MSKKASSSLKSERLPPLMKLKPDESQSIQSMFRLYDYRSSGRIPKHLAKKLTQNLGFDIPVGNLGADVSIKDLLLFIDQWIPEYDNKLQGEIAFFQKLARDIDPTMGEVITPESLNSFIEKLGRPPISMGEANLLLSSMLEYDDCSEVPKIRVDDFGKDVTMFTKKSNILKDFH